MQALQLLALLDAAHGATNATVDLHLEHAELVLVELELELAQLVFVEHALELVRWW